MQARTPIVCILAGGRAARMGADKASLELCGVRIIDRVVERVAPQAGFLFIAGGGDRETGLLAVEDDLDAPPGPLGGLWTAHAWIAARNPDATGFFTVPVDAPFVSEDLVARLFVEGACAIACDGTGDHPTFAYWDMARLADGLAAMAAERHGALHRLADRCGARRIHFSSSALVNINTPADLAAAERVLAGA
jgi:molybdopterin-guanine dinucleotide biosynthesis protein A